MKQAGKVAAAMASAALAFFVAPDVWAKDKKSGAGVNPAGPHAPAGIRWTGEIVSIGPDKVVIMGNKGAESEFVINPDTKFGKDKAQIVSDFKKGDKILLISAEENGRRIARQIINVGAASKKAIHGAKSP